jgi:hypothetical protein
MRAIKDHIALRVGMMIMPVIEAQGALRALDWPALVLRQRKG